MINISPSSSLPKREEGVPGRVVSNHFLFRPIPCLCIFPCMWEPYCKILFLFRPEISTEAKGQKLLFLPRKIPSSDPKTQSPIVFKGRKKRGSPIDTRFFLENTDIPGELLSFPPSLSHLSPLFPQRGPCGQKAAAKKSSSLPPSPKPPWGPKRRKEEKPRRPSWTEEIDFHIIIQRFCFKKNSAVSLLSFFSFWCVSPTEKESDNNV